MRNKVIYVAIVTILTTFAIGARRPSPPNGIARTENENEFPIPEQIVALSEAVSPKQCTSIMAAIRKAELREELEDGQGQGLGELKRIEIVKVPLGTIGNGFVVSFAHSPSCGNGGCPMWMLLLGPNGYHVAIKAGGWGFSLVPSVGSVPDIAFYWQMGADETDVTQFRYAHGKFVPVASRPAKCGGQEDMRGVCAHRSTRSFVWSIVPAEYNSLARKMQRKTASPRASANFGQAHAITFSLVNHTLATVVGTGSCTPENNCTISIYGCNHSTSDNLPENVPECEYWPMLHSVSGWGVADVSDWTSDPSRVSFVIARRMSASEVQLSRYAAVTDDPQPGTLLLPDSCWMLTSKTGKWPVHWDPKTLTARTTPCTDSSQRSRPTTR